MRFPFALIFLAFFETFAVEMRFEGLAPRSLDTAMLKREYARIGRQVGLLSQQDTLPLHIIFYRHKEIRKTGISLPEWGGGGAVGKDTIVIPVDRPSAFYRSDMERIILHEMVHIALARSYGHLRLPRWFHEGMAMTLSGELQFEEQLFLSRAILGRSLISLDSMEALNRFSRWRAQVAYSQCHFAVSFLLDTYGIDLIPELLAASRKTRRFEYACLEVFGLTVDELDKLMRKEMVSRYRLLFFFADYSLFWTVVVVLATVAFFATLIRKKRQRERMEREEEVLGQSS